MLARLEFDAIRICVAGITPFEVPTYLEDIGWTGAYDALMPVARLVRRDLVDSIAIALDVGAFVFPRVGIECGIFERDLHVSRQRWEKLFNHLVDHDLCTPAKRDALVEWIGRSAERNNPDIWPPNLREVSDFLGPTAQSGFARRMSHIKLVVHPYGDIEVKAYIEAFHEWLHFNIGQRRWQKSKLQKMWLD